MRRLPIVLAVIAMLLVFVGRMSGPSPPVWDRASPEVQAILWRTPRPLTAFTLSGAQGDALELEQLRGRWHLVYFGYLQCPDVCPTTLQALHGLKRLLSDDVLGSDTRMLFVSIDPGQDTPARIAEYLRFFGDGVDGYSGEPGELARLTGSLGVLHEEHQSPDGSRSIDHTTAVIVIDPQARGVAALDGPHQPRRMEQEYRRLRKFLDPN